MYMYVWMYGCMCGCMDGWLCLCVHVGLCLCACHPPSSVSTFSDAELISLVLTAPPALRTKWIAACIRHRRHGVLDGCVEPIYASESTAEPVRCLEWGGITFMCHASCIMHHASCVMHHVSCIMCTCLCICRVWRCFDRALGAWLLQACGCHLSIEA